MKKFQRSKDRRHVALMSGRAQQCQAYPDEFCKLACKTIVKEQNQEKFKGINMLSGTVKQQSINEVTKGITAIRGLEMPSPHEDLYDGYDCVDDTTGKHLDHGLAAEARKLEIDFFKNIKVYEKVPRCMARGHKVLSTPWIDINKGDAKTRNYRARLVGR